jgi:hypothetical protein
VTAAGLEQGDLRVLPRDGDVSVAIRGKQYIAAAAPVATRFDAFADWWRVSVRLDR